MTWAAAHVRCFLGKSSWHAETRTAGGGLISLAWPAGSTPGPSQTTGRRLSFFFFYFHVFTVSYFSARSRSCAEADSCCSEEKPQGAFLQESCAPSSWSTEPLQTLLLFGFNTNLCSVSFIYIYIKIHVEDTLISAFFPPPTLWAHDPRCNSTTDAMRTVAPDHFLGCTPRQ